ncbi:putative zinc finger protein CONSTANS-LIKE 11 isoform X2 [Olea europaea var. sylvestris]|uniref:putative zinc finger protein CONSTANS-LIKE 11 isoform X2 n=1 Tax=Olea europaea var. sylvestris TaxID=158386 RepID=UPI000C1D812D|nr:putative zinc finger protein CONSTANS-LIKE 11 isoform X2 [Olea europaea var. sylvestris]
MSSDLFVFENPVSSDSPIDPFHDIFQEIEENGKTSLNLLQGKNPFDEINSLDQIASTQFENLSLYHLTNPENSVLEVKAKEDQFPFDSFSDHGNSILHEFYDVAAESAVKFMHRSYSSNSFENIPNFLFQPRFDNIFESQNLQNDVLNSPESSFSSGQMRRICSAGDLQMKEKMRTRNLPSSSPLSNVKSLIAEANVKARRYTAEERKERIDRYRAKRTQRNFNRTIKYVCRKTLADGRQRIRGRFARNDEARETRKASMCNGYEEEDDLWVILFSPTFYYINDHKALHISDLKHFMMDLYV